MITGYDPETHFERVGFQTQYFLDDTMVEWVKNVTRTNHVATKHPSSPILHRDQAWEFFPHFNTTVQLLREEDGRWRCWYLDFTRLSFETGGAEALFEPRICYAESADGISWQKPTLGAVKKEGCDTNIMAWDSPHGTPIAMSIIRDPSDPDPKRRYKMAYLPEKFNINVPKRGTVCHSHSLGLCIAYSADGLNWTQEPANPVNTIWGSDVLALVYESELERYVIYGRGHYAAETGNPARDQWFTPYYPAQPYGFIPKRAVYRLESKDLINWSPAKRVLAPGKYHNLDDQFYAIAYFRMGRYHCGLMPVFHTVENTKDTELVYSHDGVQWHHYSRGPWVVPRGGQGAWDEFQIDTVVPPLRVGDRHFIYYSGSDFHHDWAFVGKNQGLDIPEADLQANELNEGLGLATLRADGFVSLDAGLRDGIICTRPFFSTGQKLIINARCGEKGHIDVEITDPLETPWNGFTREDCDSFHGDEVEHVVTWQGRPAVNEIMGYTRLRFYMKDAQLYSFRVADA
jgi:hypothetical protein